MGKNYNHFDLDERYELYLYLPRAKAKRGRRYYKRRREPLANRRSIHDRPKDVEGRETFGHWEGDLMNFRTQKGNLLTLMERKTRFTFTASLQTKTAAETAQNIQERLSVLPPNALKTITFNNGGEFAHFAKIEDVQDIETYFCDPHSPWHVVVLKIPTAFFVVICREKPTLRITRSKILMTSHGI